MDQGSNGIETSDEELYKNLAALEEDDPDGDPNDEEEEKGCPTVKYGLRHGNRRIEYIPRSISNSHSNWFRVIYVGGVICSDLTNLVQSLERMLKPRYLLLKLHKTELIQK